MIRKATPSDLPALVALARHALLSVDIGDVRISLPRIAAQAQRLVSDSSSLVLINERTDQQIDGAIVVAVNDAIWFERKVGCILLWHAQTPGTGYSMLWRAVRWCSERPAIKAVGFSEDFCGGERIGKLLERVGLTARGSVFARY